MYAPLKIGDYLIEKPIVQGGMGVGISLSNLAGNVSKCGGLGVLSAAQIGYLEEDYEKNPVEANLRAIGKHIKRAKEIACNKMVGINIMVATRYYERYVKAAVEAGADIIISGAGLPVDLPEYVSGSKTCIAPIVSSVKSANVILKYWDRKYNRVPDLLVIEGPLAGGHLGFSREELDNIDGMDFPQEIAGILKVAQEYSKKYNKKIPVIMGGGIYEKADVDSTMALGVDGVQVASRFVTTRECDADERYKQAYINAKQEDIIIVKSPVGMPGRAIKNKFIENAGKTQEKIKKCYQCIKGCNCVDIPYCITKALVNAAKGNVEDALLFCGAKSYKATKIETVEEVIAELMA